MHILLLGPRYWIDFTLLGHTETHLLLETYETPLETVLEQLPTPPDCIIQVEDLGHRRFLTGLEHAPCPTMFVAFDAHLNLYWQQYYGRLFDAVLTPHVSLFRSLPPDLAHPNIFRQAPAGVPLDWQPHAGRHCNCAFCGRLSSTRPVRSWMVELLRGRFGMEVRQDIPASDMVRLYADTRIVPNETIGFEVNLRLLEAASAGAAVLSPDCGPDQTALFADGEEFLVYNGGRDLCEKAAWLLSHPEAAETMGRKAYERVRREHLPEHRASAVIDALPALSQARATGRDAAIFIWLTRLERALAGDREHPARELFAQSEALPETPEILSGMLRLLGAPVRKTAALEFCHALLEGNTAPPAPAESRNSVHAFAVAATASACAMAHGDFDLARRFFARYAANSESGTAVPEGPAGMCLAWAEAYALAGAAVRPGFTFQPEAGHIPACGLEFCIFARHLRPDLKAQLKREEARLLAPFPAYAPYRLSLLESLRKETTSPEETRELAELLIFCCRVDEGEALLRTL